MSRLRVVEILEATEGGTRTHLRHLLEGLDLARFELFALVSTRRTPHFLDDMTMLLTSLQRARATRATRGESCFSG